LLLLEGEEMSKQSKALRWADLLEYEATAHGPTDYKHNAAAELRRLHEANQAMLEALSSIDVYLSDTLSGRVKPEPETHKEWLVEGIIEARNRARAAIAKGEQQ
jgi:hypothetical protein